MLKTSPSHHESPIASSTQAASETDWSTLIANAWQHRLAISSANQTDSWRIFHGYHEGFTGVTIEKFGNMAMIDFKVDIRSQLNEIKDALLVCFPFTVIVAKGHQSLGLRLHQRLLAIHGTFEEASEFAEEYGVYYSLKPDAAHNCGLYLDARPVRHWLLNNTKSTDRILNLFAFAGSLGVAAKKAGAKEVIHLDKSKELLPRIEKSYTANNLTFDARSFLQGDIYKHLPKAIKHKQTFDGIILDPPPKVYQSSHASHRPKGQDFSALVQYCARLINPDGWLICMFHRFDATWDQADQEIIQASKDTLVLSEHFTSEEDFPEHDSDKKLRISIFKKRML